MSAQAGGPIYSAGELMVTPPEGTCLLGFRGSVAHGMYIPPNDPNSIDDIDLMGVVIGEKRHYFGLHEWGSRGTLEIKQGRWDCVFYELKKMVSLLLQGNPNVMSLLWMRQSDYNHGLTNPHGWRLIENRYLFVGKHVYNAFAGYAYQQLTKMETREPAELREYLAVTQELKARGKHPNHKGETFDREHSGGEYADVTAWGDDKLVTRLRHFQRKGENIGYMGDKRKQLVLEHGYDAKNAAHLIRLLRMCKEFMETGEMIVFRPDAEELLSIKRGQWALADVKALSDQLFAEAKEAKNKSTLPEEPQYDKAEQLVMDILSEHFAVRAGWWVET